MRRGECLPLAAQPNHTHAQFHSDYLTRVPIVAEPARAPDKAQYVVNVLGSLAASTTGYHGFAGT